MEATEVLVQVYTPGVMVAGLGSWIFWLGMGLAFAAGYVAAFPSIMSWSPKAYDTSTDRSNS